jgi:two-component system, LytTR family, sensor kinase
MLSAKQVIAGLIGLVHFNSVVAQLTQTYNVDSLRQVLTTELNDTNRIWALNNLGRNIQNSDSILESADEAISLSRKIGFAKGEVEAYNNVGYLFNQKGNYPRALKSYLKAIQLGETANYLPGLRRSYNSIATVYLYLKDTRRVLRMQRKRIT